MSEQRGETNEADHLQANAEAAISILVALAGDLGGSGAYEAAGRAMGAAKVIRVLAAELARAREAIAVRDVRRPDGHGDGAERTEDGQAPVTVTSVGQTGGITTARVGA